MTTPTTRPNRPNRNRLSPAMRRALVKLREKPAMLHPDHQTLAALVRRGLVHVFDWYWCGLTPEGRRLAEKVAG